MSTGVWIYIYEVDAQHGSHYNRRLSPYFTTKNKQIIIFIMNYYFFSNSDFPCNNLPCLQMDNGDMMPETMAICRYLAREHGK